MTEAEHPRAQQEREAVGRLSRLILAKLAQRRHHGDWRTQSMQSVHDHLWSEWHEAWAEFTAERGTETDAFEAELVDVAACIALAIDRRSQS